jgi:hypothetical protein
LRLMTLYRIEGHGGPTYQIFVETSKGGLTFLGIPSTTTRFLDTCFLELIAVGLI